MAGNLQPLDEKFAIVDAQGRPTLYFIKWAQQRQIDITEGITLPDLENYLTAHMLREGSGIQFTPDGDLNNSPLIAADVQEILDQITSTRGSLLYRGLLGWAALLPGTSGNLLQTNGAGADPAWVLPPGGIEISRTQPLLANFTQVNVLGTSVAANTSKGVKLTATGGGTNLQGLMKAIAPGGADFTAIMRLHTLRQDASTAYQAMLAVRNSTNGRWMVHGELGTVNDVLQTWTAAGTFSGTAVPSGARDIRMFPWRKLVRSGANLNWYTSMDGENWGIVLLGNAGTGFAPANFLENGTGTIDQVGFGIMSSGATTTIEIGTICTSFTLTQP